MSNAEADVQVRPMALSDLEDMLSVDKEIRAAGASITYRDFTTQQILGIEAGEADSPARPSMLEVAKLVDYGFVAEDRGRICGFVVGRQTCPAERDIQEGEIAIIGVHPDYQGKLVATELVDRVCRLFRARGVHRVRIGLDPLDRDLQAFFERFDFRGQQVLYYGKTL